MSVPSGAFVISGGRVVDPSQSIDQTLDVVVRDGAIAGLVPPGSTHDLPIVAAEGRLVTAGLVDLHVHLRTPGQQHKETISTGTAAAAAGGFTTLCCMPNTTPPVDNVGTLRELMTTIERETLVRVFPTAAISLGRAGEEPADYRSLFEAGAVAFTDDGDSTKSSLVMRRALEASRELGCAVMVHCEDKALAAGSMHEGDVSRELGVPGIPPEAEEIMLARDLMLGRLTGGWLHVQHVTTARGVDLIARAKAEGVRVTAEATPHHLLMTDEWIAGRRAYATTDEPPGAVTNGPDALAKVNPPLRPESDARALLRALIDGTLDIIATDHAPHTMAEKQQQPFERAPMGMSGLEFALPLILSLVRAGHLTLTDAVARMATIPGRLLGKGTGTLLPGSAADIVVIDPDAKWTVEAEALKTKSSNTPLLGMSLHGRAVLTFVDGEPRFVA
jgi:dihydroorotase